MENNKYQIREDWEDYYKTLEAIRRTGVVNMYGAAPYLRECYPDELTNDQAKDVLINWIENYKELNEKFGWQ